MKLYDKIKTIVEANRIAITQQKNGTYTLWSSISSDGIRCSELFKNVDNCRLTLGIYNCVKKQINDGEEKGEKFIGVYSPKTRRPKVGDKVEVIVGDIFSKPLIVTENLLIGCIIQDDKGGKFSISYDCLSPWVEKDEDKPREYSMEEIAEALKIPVSDLIIKK